MTANPRFQTRTVQMIGSLFFQIDEVLSELSGGGGEDEEKGTGFKPEHVEEMKKGSELKDLKDLVR